MKRIEPIEKFIRPKPATRRSWRRSPGMVALLPCLVVFILAGICRASNQAAVVNQSSASENLGETLKTVTGNASLIDVFKKGGPVMWPLLLASILAQGTVIERITFLINEQRKRDPQAVKDFFSAVGQGHLQQAILISEASEFYILRVLGYALTHSKKSLANALVYAQEEEMKRYRRGISILDTVITLAPLLGLLGTVTGMMGSFSLIGGELSAPGAITGGIAEALIATAFGLGIAITGLIPFNLLNTKMEEARLELESASTQLEMLMQPFMQPAPETPAPVAEVVSVSTPIALRPVFDKPVLNSVESQSLNLS